MPPVNVGTWCTYGSLTIVFIVASTSWSSNSCLTCSSNIAPRSFESLLLPTLSIIKYSISYYIKANNHFGQNILYYNMIFEVEQLLYIGTNQPYTNFISIM